jgi:hypothetical protein
MSNANIVAVATQATFAASPAEARARQRVAELAAEKSVNPRRNRSSFAQGGY